jgi:osomolarity two-component system phosphorelay intermediate protein YPD1
MTKVKDSCEKIQHFGAHLKKIIKQAKQEFAEVEKRLRQFYEPSA